jgi:hypothetical protein
MELFKCELLDLVIDSNFFGIIVFSKDYVKYKFTLMNGHYTIESTPVINYVDYNEDKVGYTYQFFGSPNRGITNYDLMKIKYTPLILLDILNNHKLGIINTYLIFNYIDKYYPNERNNCYISLSRFKRAILRHNLKPYGFKFDGPSIKEMKCLDPVNGDFPDSIDTLKVKFFNQNMDVHIIPDTISTLIIDSQHNIRINIPKSVTTLTLKGINLNYLSILNSLIPIKS